MEYLKFSIGILSSYGMAITQKTSA